MAIKAKADITLSVQIDIIATTKYYLLQSSTATPPSKIVDNTEPPSTWTETEPTYTDGSTNTLYTIDRTIFSNGTWTYSDVSKSTSYEAAKAAYNKAVDANTTANIANSTAQNAESVANQVDEDAVKKDVTYGELPVDFMTTDNNTQGVVIHENGLLEANNANIRGTIHANQLILGNDVTFNPNHVEGLNASLSNMIKNVIPYYKQTLNSIDPPSTANFPEGWSLTVDVNNEDEDGNALYTWMVYKCEYDYDDTVSQPVCITEGTNGLKLNQAYGNINRIRNANQLEGWIFNNDDVITRVSGSGDELQFSHGDTANWDYYAIQYPKTLLDLIEDQTLTLSFDIKTTDTTPNGTVLFRLLKSLDESRDDFGYAYQDIWDCPMTTLTSEYQTFHKTFTLSDWVQPTALEDEDPSSEVEIPEYISLQIFNHSTIDIQITNLRLVASDTYIEYPIISKTDIAKVLHGEGAYTSISKDGLLQANNAIIKGTMYADNGYFAGELRGARLVINNNDSESSVAIEEMYRNVQSNTDDLSDTQVSLGVLEDRIMNLVRTSTVTPDGQVIKQTLVTQDDDGIYFDMTSYIESLGGLREDIAENSQNIGNIEADIANNTTNIEELTQRTAYIDMTTDEEGRPLIVLGERKANTDSDNDTNFRLEITNEDIKFKEGENTPAYINNQSMHIKSATIENELIISSAEGDKCELRIGDFVLAQRESGNVGFKYSPMSGGEF